MGSVMGTPSLSGAIDSSDVEALLYRLYILPSEVMEVEASTPKRSRA